MMLDISTYIIIGLLVLLGVTCFYAIRFGLIILAVQDAIEGSLDVLDDRYKSIGKILQIPLYYDSNEIRTVLQDVRVCRDEILLIARTLAAVDEEAVEETGSDFEEIISG
jgi:hypothetical protein